MEHRIQPGSHPFQQKIHFPPKTRKITSQRRIAHWDYKVFRFKAEQGRSREFVQNTLVQINFVRIDMLHQHKLRCTAGIRRRESIDVRQL
jgi:hypothetical protein